jgi:hypothetical protein
MNSSLRSKILPLAIASMLAAALPAMAQDTSSSITGRVLDASGQPVAGATVQIVHEPSGTTKIATTDADGRYSAQGMRVGGPFDVTVSKAGLSQAKQDNVYLQLSQGTAVNLTMGAAGAQNAQNLQGVTVSANALSQTFSSENKGFSTNVSRRELDATPMPDRSIQNVARLDPRIVITDRDRGAISAMGQNNRYNSITVDSVNAGDPFGLNDNGLPTLGTPISVDAIEEYNISTANYDVTTRRGVGANINAVTKSGTNEFHGSVYYSFQNAKDMIGEDATGNDWNGYSRQWNAGATFGGPIIKDKLFFFANYEKGVKVAPGGNWGPEGSGMGNVVQGLTQADVSSIIDIAKQKGLTPGDYTGSSNANLQDKRSLVKLDWNISDGQRASMTYSRTQETQPIITSSFSDSLKLSSNYYLNDTDNKSLAFHLYSDWTDIFSTEASFSSAKFHKDRGPINGIAQPAVTVTTEKDGPAVVLGTEYSSQANVLDVKTKNAALAGTLYLDEHTLKGGVDFQKDDYYNLFLQRLYGDYTFDTIADFQNGTYFRYQLGIPAAGYALGDVAARFSLNQYGIYLQDTWQVNSNLSVQFGARVDVPLTDDQPILNPCFAAPVGAAGVGNQGVCGNVTNAKNPNAAIGGFGYANTHTINGNRVVQPRFSFNYQFDTERMTQLRGGAGLFISNAPGVWIGNPYAGNGVTVASYNISSGVKPAFSADPNNQNVPANSTVPGTNGSKMRVDTIDENFRLPTVWKLSIGVDHELPWFGTIFTAEYEYLKARNAVQYQNINLGAPTGLLPDGRNSYFQNPNGSPADRNNTNRWNANPSFDSVTRLTNTDKGWSDNLTLSLKKPFSESWSGTIGVSGGRSKDVNPGTSSVAYSSYQYRAWVNPNDAELSTSNYSIPLRALASLNWQHKFFGDYTTSVSAFYDGHSGAPYSWIFGNDVNGDAVSRDLVYIPGSASDVQWAPKVTEAMKTQFMDYINNDDYLKDHKGRIAQRNGGRAPWVNQLDLSFRQEIPGFFEGAKGEFRLDFYNVTNMLNKKWGVETRADFPLTRTLADSAGVDPVTGKYIYDISGSKYLQDGVYRPASLKPNESINPSQRWSVLATVRYTF